MRPNATQDDEVDQGAETIDLVESGQPLGTTESNESTKLVRRKKSDQPTTTVWRALKLVFLFFLSLSIVSIVVEVFACILLVDIATGKVTVIDRKPVSQATVDLTKFAVVIACITVVLQIIQVVIGFIAILRFNLSLLFLYTCFVALNFLLIIYSSSIVSGFLSALAVHILILLLMCYMTAELKRV